MNDYSEYEEHGSCTCNVCAEMCRVPCWGTPEEMEAILDAGFGNKLDIASRSIGDYDDPAWVQILAPARHPFNRDDLNQHLYCAFFKEGLCTLHELGLKPIEGRTALHGKSNGNIRDDIAYDWHYCGGDRVIGKWSESYE